MFTGIIEDIGTITSLKSSGQAKRIEIQSQKIIQDLKVDDSVAINGICLTVVKINNSSFECESVEETLKKTTLKLLKAGQKVNLERALTLQSRIGGHLVQGHVDSIGKIDQIKFETLGKIFTISFPSEFRKYLIQVGSICIDGVSLTIANLHSNNFELSIIPHTYQTTIFQYYKVGDSVNLEFDLIGKYVENFINKADEFEEKLNIFLNS